MIVELDWNEIDEVNGASLIRDIGRAVGSYIRESWCTPGTGMAIYC